MNQRSKITESEAPHLLDRLACGELNDADRRGLLDWLEQEPARWRQCGLAFLEAQAWSQTLGGWPPAPASDIALDLRTADNRRSPGAAPRARRQATAGQWLAAAAILLAFGLGWTADRILAPHPLDRYDSIATSAAPSEAPSSDPETVVRGQSAEPVFAAVDARAGGNLGSATPIRIPVVPVDAASADSGFTDEDIPDYVLRQWERRGFKLSLERRYLFATLPDGKRVVVPVQQYHVDPIPVQIN